LLVQFESTREEAASGHISRIANFRAGCWHFGAIRFPTPSQQSSIVYGLFFPSASFYPFHLSSHLQFPFSLFSIQLYVLSPQAFIPSYSNPAMFYVQLLTPWAFLANLYSPQAFTW
jgi:hypothetical protein